MPKRWRDDSPNFEFALELLHERRRLVATSEEGALSYRRISRLSLVPFETLWNWDHTDMSPSARHDRALAHAWNRLITPFQELELAGWVFYSSLHGFNTSTSAAALFAFNRFKKDIDSDWLVDFKQRQHISDQDVHYANRAEFDSATFERVVQLLQDVRALNIPPERIYCIDKMYVKDEPSSTHQMGPVGMYAFALSGPPFEWLILSQGPFAKTRATERACCGHPVHRLDWLGTSRSALR